MNSFSNSCSSSFELTSTNTCSHDNLSANLADSEEEKGCCGDTNICDCLCCGHIFIGKSTPKPQLNRPEQNFKHIYHFNEIFKSISFGSIWQPPRIV